MIPDTYFKAWGREIWIANSPLYCGKVLVLKKNHFCSLHFHLKKDETFYILEGSVLMEIKDGDNKEIESFVMEEGENINIPPGVAHRFTGMIDSKILEVSTQHFEDDSFRLSESGRIE